MLATRRALLLGFLAACTAAEQQRALDVLGAVSGPSGAPLSAAEAAEGIRAALEQGTGDAVASLARRGGYLDDPQVRIPLPPRLASLQDDLARFGLSGQLDALEVELNRGAEAAAPAARAIFLDAIRGMTIQDAVGIVRGSDTAATDYFRGRTTPALTRAFRPIMQDGLQRAGAIRTFDALAARLAQVPLAPQLAGDAKADLIDHGVALGLDGLFAYVAREEAAIRRNPAKRGSEILRRVFG